MTAFWRVLPVTTLTVRQFTGGRTARLTFALSLIPSLGGNRLLGTYFGFYYLVQGSGTVVGNLAIGAAFDTGTRLGLPILPWLLLLGFGLASAASMTALDCKELKVHRAGVSPFAIATKARS